MKISLSSAVVLASAAAFLSASTASAQTTSVNSGSLGSAGNGLNSSDVTLGLSGAISAGGDTAVGYSGGARTTVPFNSALNPSSSSPFTIEFWAKPDAITDDATGPSPLFNRVTASPRSGWVFFQRSPTTGWNFRMYDGNGDNVGFDLTGGSNALGTWSHVVAVWDGTSPTLYVNGVLADNTNTAGNSGIYQASSSAILTLGSYDNGNNPFNGSLDEFAFYNSALTLSQIVAHYNAASSPTPGAYSSLVLADGAVEYLQNVPEPSAISLVAVGLIGCVGLKRHRRQR